MKTAWPGKPYPLGATFDGYGTNFAVFSGVAERVQLCLFDGTGDAETRIDMTRGTGAVWHAFLPEVGPSTRSGFISDWRSRCAFACPKIVGKSPDRI